jgi:uncharacterized membrane protein
MILELIGKLHPLLVHLPIGILLLFILFDLLQTNGKASISTRIMWLMLLSGLTTGIFSLITGYSLSLDGSNDGATLDRHKWIAIVTITFFSLYGFISLKHELNKKIKIVSLVVLFILISITGHLGGTLTHGEDYWSFLSINKFEDTKTAPYTVSNIKDAMVFDDLIMVSLKQKCIQCHGIERQKGNLRMDSKEWFMKGGKDGLVVNLKDLDKSEILKRIFLDLNEDHHMPPKKKEQLSDEEKDIFEWWIKAGAPFSKKVSEIEKSASIDSILHVYHEKLISFKTKKEIERIQINSLTEASLQSLIKSGWAVSLVSKTDNHLRVSGFNLEKTMDSSLEQLIEIKDYIVELKLSFQKLNEKQISIISALTNLEKLWLDHSSLTGKSVHKLSTLKSLKYLNISNNELNAEDIIPLKDLVHLEKLYIEEAGIDIKNYNTLKSTFSNTKIYIVRDTMINAVSDSIFKKPLR